MMHQNANFNSALPLNPCILQDYASTKADFHSVKFNECPFHIEKPKRSLTDLFIFSGAHGQAVCPSVMKQRQVQIPLQPDLSSSRGRTRVQELYFGLTQPTKSLRSEPSPEEITTPCTVYDLCLFLDLSVTE